MKARLNNWLAEIVECVTPCCKPTIRGLKLNAPQSKEDRQRGYWSSSSLRALLPLRQTQENTTTSAGYGMREQTTLLIFLGLLDNGMQFSERIVLINSALAPTAHDVTYIYIFVAVAIALIQLVMLLCTYSGKLRNKIARSVAKFGNLKARLNNWLAEIVECVTPCCKPTIRGLKLNAPQSKEDRQRGYWSFSSLRARGDLRHVRCLNNPARVLAW